jgi:hypothetical protein
MGGVAGRLSSLDADALTTVVAIDGFKPTGREIGRSGWPFDVTDFSGLRGDDHGDIELETGLGLAQWNGACWTLVRGPGRALYSFPGGVLGTDGYSGLLLWDRSNGTVRRMLAQPRLQVDAP